MQVHAVEVSFGDCDPAGIVFYPNYFRWMDATVHRLLQERAGGHARLRRELRAVGIGMMDVGKNFRMPVRDGQRILVRLTGIDGGRRGFVEAWLMVTARRRILDDVSWCRATSSAGLCFRLGS